MVRKWLNNVYVVMEPVKLEDHNFSFSINLNQECQYTISVY